jgi:hypothetical protein
MGVQQCNLSFESPRCRHIIGIHACQQLAARRRRRRVEGGYDTKGWSGNGPDP